MAGTYPEYNLSSEPELLRHIYEANVGIRVLKKAEVWLDAGIFPSHIGFERAINTDSRTLTRSILAENSPYYEAGARLSYKTQNGKWYAAALLLNGWQRVKRPDGNNTPAFGTQLTFEPFDKLLLQNSTLLCIITPGNVDKTPNLFFQPMKFDPGNVNSLILSL
jgi:hypothetical protein